MNTLTVDRTQTQPQPLRPLALLFRLHWMLGGFIIVFVLAVSMMRHDTPLVSWESLGVWLAALSMIVVRYVNIVRFGGLTADGERATLQDLIGYAAGTLAFTAAVWVWALWS